MHNLIEQAAMLMRREAEERSKTRPASRKARFRRSAPKPLPHLEDDTPLFI